MTFLNLTLAEFLGILIPVSAAVVALYLYDRSRRRQVVSTLRFYPQWLQAPVFTRRKKIQQPWSLALQLVSIALLLAAIAEPVLRRAAERGRDHVLILETSAWMNAAGPDHRSPLMQAARRRALEYLRAIPGSDRVLLIRADGLATPVTGFTRDRRELEEAIRQSRPGATALNLPAALDLARSVQRLSSSRPGEIAVIGSGRIPRADAARAAETDATGLRAILLGAEPNDCGIRKLSARRPPASPLEWEVEVGAHNFGAAEHRHAVRLSFGGARVGSRALTLPAHGSAEAVFRFRSREPGLLEAELDARDDYAADNRASLELPGLIPVKVQVYTANPARWQPLLTSSPFLDPEFHSPAEYSPRGSGRRLVVLDGITPAPPEADSIWIAADRPLAQVQIRRWNREHPIAAGLSDKDIRLSHAAVLRPAPAEAVIAETESGPVLAASAAGSYKRLLFGFHPVEEGAENHLATPLLFANIVRWIWPDLFRLTELVAGPPGLIEVRTPPGTRREQVRVSSAEVRDPPFTLVEDRLRLFVARPATVHVSIPGQELVYSLKVPEVGEVRWTPPGGVRQGVPPAAPGSALQWPLWPWLAVLGTLGLLLEWVWFGRRPAVAAPAGLRVSAEAPARAAVAQEAQL